MNLNGFSLGVLIPVWQRPEVTRLVLDYYKRMEIPGLKLTFLIMCSPGDPFHEQWEGYASDNFIVHSYRNKPLSEKWNYGVRLLSSGLDIDALTVIGSDDFANKDYIREGCKLIAKGNDYVSASGVYFYSVDDNELFYTSVEGVGACAFLSMKAIRENFKGFPFPENRDSGVDMGFKRRCIQKGIEKFGSIDVNYGSDFTFVDVKKTGKNINGFKHLAKIFMSKAKWIDPKDYFITYFDEGLYNNILEIPSHA